MTSLDVQMAYRLASEAGHAWAIGARGAASFQTMLRADDPRGWMGKKAMLNLPVALEVGLS
ncbi:MAG: hypothetical protein IPJ97_13375 [Proteobacteria bacterium]|nr:hypothetical protein [Pseudomonadota bacterium]